MLVQIKVESHLFEYFRKVSEIPVDKRVSYKDSDIEFKFIGISRIDYFVHLKILHIKSPAYTFKYLLCKYAFNGSMFLNIKDIKELHAIDNREFIYENLGQTSSFNRNNRIFPKARI